MQVQVKWKWVEGHAVERKGRHRSSSTVPERLNNQVDKLAKAALLFLTKAITLLIWYLLNSQDSE
jgi:hypothetical protein